MLRKMPVVTSKTHYGMMAEASRLCKLSSDCAPFASFQQKSTAALLPHISIYHVYTVHTISPTDNFNSEFQP